MSKHHPRIKVLLTVFIVLITCVFAIGCIALWLIDYETLTNILLKIVHKEAWRPYFEQHVFPPYRFLLLQYIAIPFSLLWFLFACWFYKKTNYFSTSLFVFANESKKKIQQQISKFEAQEYLCFCLLLLAFCVRGLLQIYRYELQYDEAWTYNHFISNGFLVSAISPNNNHILYTLFACLFDYIPLGAKYTLRLPVYLGGIGTCILFYWMLRSFVRWQWAMLALVWFAFSPAICFYSMYARGYIFQIFFTVFATWASFKMVTHKASNYHWHVWILSSILGFYSVPTYAYVWVVLNVFLVIHLFRNRVHWKRFIWSNVIVLLGTCILYFPFLVTNGLSTLIDVASTKAPQGEAFINYQDKVADWVLLGAGRLTPVYWFWVLLLFFALPIWWKTQQASIRRSIELTLLFLLFPSILNLIVGTQPPYRVWCFLTIFIGVLIGLLGNFYLSKFKSSAFTVVLALLLSSCSIWRTEVHYAIRWSADLDRTVKEMSRVLLENNFSEVYLFSNYDKPLLTYYYLVEKKRLKVYMSAVDSKNYAPFVNAPVYEVVLWDKEDRTSSLEEELWLKQHYPTVLYEDHRVVLKSSIIK